MHDVMVGMWKPRPHEAKAGLKPRDFCTLCSLVTAQLVLGATGHDYKQVLMKGAAPGGVYPIPQCKDAKNPKITRPCKTGPIQSGELGMAYQMIYKAYDVKLDLPVNAAGIPTYDFTCKKTANWPEPDKTDAVSRQKIYLKPNTTTEKCEFSETRTGYSVFQPSDAKRCFMDSQKAKKGETVDKRRTDAKDDRQECKLWDAKKPVPWNKDEIACVPLDSKTCDDACKKDPKTLKHKIYKCAKELECMKTGPLDKANNGAWVEDKAKVDPSKKD